MDLLTADYVVLGFTLGGAVIGLLIGFSGAFAFLCGSIAAAAFGHFFNQYLRTVIDHGGLRGLVLTVSALLAFGLVRIIVRRFVRGMLAQPGDAVFGMLTASAAGVVLSLGGIWLWNFVVPDHAVASILLRQVLGLIGSHAA